MTALIVLGAIASAQEGFDAHGFHLAAYDGDVRDPLAVSRAGPFVQGDFWFGLLGEYAKAPLVEVRSLEPGGDGEEIALLDNVVIGNLSAGVAVHDRVRLDVGAPLVATSSSGLTAASDGVTAGDVRISAMVVGVRPRHIVGGGGFGREQLVLTLQR